MTPLLDSSRPITRALLFDALDQHLTRSYARKLRSLVGRALAAAGCPDDSARDIRLLLANLDRLDSTRAVAADAPAACRKVRALVLGRTGTHRLVLPNKGTLLPKAWTSLLHHNTRDNKRRAASRLQALARAVDAAGGGDVAPVTLPPTADIYTAAARIGLSEKTVLNAIRIYRRLRRRAIEVDSSNRQRYAVIDDRRRIRGRNAVAALRARGDTEVSDAMSAIAHLAPRLHAQLRRYQSHPVVKGKTHQPSTIEATVAACSRLVGALFRFAPERLATFTIKDLWKEMATLELTHQYIEEWDEVPTTNTSVCLARWVVAVTAPEIRARCAPGLDRGYVTMAISDLKHWFSLTEWAHGINMRDTLPEEWTIWRERHSTVRQHVIENQIPKDMLLYHKDKEKIVETFNLAHMCCVIIPVLLREAERLLDRLELEIAAAEKTGREIGDHVSTLPSAVQRALTAFEERAEPALALAMMFYDGMRSVQYRMGRFGKHITPDIDTTTGEWYGVKTKWFGKRMDVARVKQGRDRARQLGTAHISMRVLRGFVQHVRSRRLIAAGVPAADATAANGRFPLFVSRVNAPEPWSDTHFQRTIVGAALYRVATELLGHRFGEESSYEEFDRQRFCGVLGTHSSRYVIATGCAVLLDDNMQLAATLTSDDSATLREAYVVSSWLPNGRLGTWENASSYREWLDRIVLPGADANPLDTLPPELLPPKVRDMIAGWAIDDRETQRRVTRSMTGSPSGRVRGARPDVAARNRETARLRGEARGREAASDVASIEHHEEADRRAA
jgi:hypothetical protein